ncbi:MAG: 6-phospho-beta-glucosidase [Bacillota bacterium]|uniref:6-phospho-beta-glucosidase n=1 Tax=Virgibacillus salarius TaxID=447199 RepID=A0A941E1Q5_9BACI|nr:MULTISPECIES: 6-phospho-beta-glucosidase [Bacillaceae]NAZ09998.1 6-phospho-beta-glucosidase [Agaribacter marinus]MBR7797288.1 6-phospho-beta-glucosidase [Virgibacillus salarius]MCC2250602.1 6-phospho-beta-glucosidase [Virgibacillus sp. AGTR]MDY7046296.1 6-phospho-beta-glucosidase [Virgibacillus sp. M23]QRZ18481.1 6-phospho-beta-glucosidase [Virgibacillus sp. AGTR]
MTVKLVVVGGGSSYTPEIIEGIIRRHDSFPVTDIVLVDIEAGKEKLEIIGNLAQRMIEKSNKPINLSWTLDRREALKQADFVSTQIRVGGLAARSKDERIPLSHGFIGQETNGAGGIFKAFRTIPVLLDLAKDVHEICPNAWIINFTNPAGIVTEALLKHSPHKKVIGVCNIPYNMRHSTAEILDADPNDVLIEFIGMNHFVFGKKVYVNGIDRTKEVLEKLSGDLDYSPANIVNLGWSKTFIEATGLLPNPYHQYYFQTKEVLEKDVKAFKENGTRAEVVQNLETSLFNIYSNPSLYEKPKELEERGGAFYSDVACSLMDSIYNNKQDVQTVNTINNGAIPDLPEDAVIEVNCMITNNGPKPISVGALPHTVKGHIYQMKAFEELVIRASISGDYNDAYTAMVMNPLLANEKGSKVVLDELLEAHKSYLPQFKSRGN